MKKRNFVVVSLLASLAFIIFFSNYILAVQESITFASGSLGESGYSNLTNISVANLNTTENITQVNLTLLSSSTIPLSSINITSLNTSTYPNVTVTNTSTTLVFTNTTPFILINASQTGSFWFNFITNQTGNISINISTLDTSGMINSTSLNVTIRDTILPTASFVTPTPVDTGTIHNTYIPVNISLSDLGSGIKSLMIDLFLLQGASLLNVSGQSPLTITNSSLFVNGSYFDNSTFVGLGDGIYYLNAWVVDNANNSVLVGNFTTHNYTIVINTTVSSGGSTSCTASWSPVWGPCISGSQSQIWTDTNNCGQTTPSSQTRACTSTDNTTCVTNWDCGNWSTCSSEGSQTMTCTDLNGCSSPDVRQRNCTLGSSLATNSAASQQTAGTTSPSLSYAFYAVGGVVIASIIAVVIILMRLKRKSYSGGGGDFGSRLKQKLGVGGYRAPPSGYPSH